MLTQEGRGAALISISCHDFPIHGQVELEGVDTLHTNTQTYTNCSELRVAGDQEDFPSSSMCLLLQLFKLFLKERTKKHNLLLKGSIVSTPDGQ